MNIHALMVQLNLFLYKNLLILLDHNVKYFIFTLLILYKYLYHPFQKTFLILLINVNMEYLLNVIIIILLNNHKIHFYIHILPLNLQLIQINNLHFMFLLKNALFLIQNYNFLIIYQVIMITYIIILIYNMFLLYINVFIYHFLVYYIIMLIHLYVYQQLFKNIFPIHYYHFIQIIIHPIFLI